MIDVYLGRQNIFNSDMNTFGYEVIYYTDSHGTNIVGKNSISSALSIIYSILEIGTNALTQGKPAFFSLSGDFVCKQKILPFQADTGGIFLDVADELINEKFISHIKRLQAQKYTIVLDNPHINRLTIPLLKEMKAARIDVSQFKSKELANLVTQLEPYELELYGYNIPDHEMFEICKSLKFRHFQGSFFTQPQIVKGHRLPSRRLFVLKMLASLYNPEIDIRDLEIIIRQDVSLGYKLMRMVNSAYYGLNSQIESIQHALVLLGINPLRSWLSVILLSEIDDQPGPLMSTAIIRGKMCELIGELIPNEETSSYFVTGLFSILDSMMGLPMSEILENLPMSEEINKALLNREGALGNTLQSVIAYEQNNWQDINLPKVSIQQIREAYLKSIAWATELTNSNLLL